MIEKIQNIDASVLLWFNSFHNNYFDILMMLVSNKLVWIPLYVSILVVIVMKYGVRIKLIYILCLFAACFALTDYTCATIIRPIFCRPRPANLESPICDMVHIVCDNRGGSYGFPSCHAANSFMLAALVALIFRNRRLTIFIYIWALLHSYSRIYLGLHYPGDILIGAMLGSAVSLALYYLLKRFINYEGENTKYNPHIISYTGITIFTVLIVTSIVVLLKYPSMIMFF